MFRYRIKETFKELLGIYNYDEQGRARINKMFQLYAKGGYLNRLRARRLCNKIRHDYCMNISPRTKIGKNLYIAHCYQIGIGITAEIGDNCRIYPNVHIASKNIINAPKGVRRHAKIGNDCILGINSTILGAITIGDDVTIGANALVTKDVPSHTIVTGINQFKPKKTE